VPPAVREQIVRDASAPTSLRSARDGRLIFFAGEAVTMLSADGTTVQRVVGFRFPAARRLRS